MILLLVVIDMTYWDDLFQEKMQPLVPSGRNREKQLFSSH